MGAGKAFLHDDRLEEPDEIRKRIDAITADQIMEVALEIFDPKKLSTLIFKGNNND